MRRRYNLTRSDNYPYTGRKSYRCLGDGFVSIITGFPVTSVIVTWSSIPFYDVLKEMSSSSSSTSSSSSLDSSSSSSSSSSSESSSSSSSEGYSSSSSSSSSSLNDVHGIGYAIIEDTFIVGYSPIVSSSSSLSSVGYSSSSSSSSSLDSSSSSSSSSVDSSSTSSSSSSLSSSSSSSEEYSSSSSSSSNAWTGDFDLPRLYIYSLQDDGFTVKYENIPEELGYIEFAYIAS